MDLGVFIPIGSNGWLISTTSPRYRPTFALNRDVTQLAERYGFEFALSMVKNLPLKSDLPVVQSSRMICTYSALYS